MNIETVSTSQENANLKTWRDALLSPVLEDLEKRRGLSAEMILKLCPLRIQERESAKLPDAIKRRLARQPNHAFKIPYNNFDGENLTGVFRVRLLDGDEPKYVGPTGVPPHIYLPKGFH